MPQSVAYNHLSEPQNGIMQLVSRLYDIHHLPFHVWGRGWDLGDRFVKIRVEFGAFGFHSIQAF